MFKLALAATLAAIAFASTVDSWLARTESAMTAAERRTYRGLRDDNARDAYRRAFWAEKAISESVFLERVAHADATFGSGRDGSGANTDQGRVYIANGAPQSIHRLPSSRVFVASEVWYYESLPRTGYRSRLQFLFYRKNGIGDFKLFSPQLSSIRDLLIPQPGTRLMFPVNDMVSANDIRGRLKYSPGEEEIVEAATGVARGITGSGNGEILSRAVSIEHMIRRDPTELTPRVESRFIAGAPPEARILQFWTEEAPVVDVQVRVTAASRIGLMIDDAAGAIERSEIPLDLPQPKQILYTHRFFLLPGTYRLTIVVDGRRQSLPLVVQSDRSQGLSGEALTEEPGELRFAITPDPRSAEALRTIADQTARRNSKLIGATAR